MIDRCLLDTNVLVYRYDRSDSVKQKKAAEVRASLASAGAGFLSTQVVCEFYNALTRLLHAPIERSVAARCVADECDVWTVLGVTPDIARRALSVAARYQVSIWDAQLVATAVEYEIPVIISEDFGDGCKYEGVVVLDPFAATFGFDQLGMEG